MRAIFFVFIVALAFLLAAARRGVIKEEWIQIGV